MQLHGAHGCASFKLGKIDDARADLAFVREHEAVSPRTVVELQLCMGDLDAAAAAEIYRLDQISERADALLELCDYAPPPPTYRKSSWEIGIETLKRRADIQAAVARAGDIRRFDIPY